MRRDTRVIRIALLDAGIGVLIGTASFLSMNLRSPGGQLDLRQYAIFAQVSAMLFGVAFFLGTLIIAPFFVRWLRDRVRMPAGRYYRSAMIGGIVFGMAASAAVGLFFPLTLALVPGVPDYTLQDRVLLTLLGPVLFVPGGLLSAIMVFGIELLGFGVLFGLFNGWLIRRTFAEEAEIR